MDIKCFVSGINFIAHKIQFANYVRYDEELVTTTQKFIETIP